MREAAEKQHAQRPIIRESGQRDSWRKFLADDPGIGTQID